MKNSFTVPKLASFPLDTCKRWYVWFRFNGGHPVKVYEGLNKIYNYEERLFEGKLLAEAIHYKLKKGWIPKVREIETKNISIKEAFEQAISRLQKKVSKNTYDAYRITTQFYIQSLVNLNFDKRPAHQFTRAYAKQTFENVVKTRNWSNSAFNKNLSYIRSVFSEIIEAEHAEINPFREIKNLKVTTTKLRLPPTDAEMILICDQLKAHNYGLYVYYMLIYHCGLRVEEVRNLQVKHLDFNEKMINLPGENSKNRTFRPVPMLGNVFELLQNCKGVDKNYFVFGTWVPNGGRHSRKNWFTPNQYQLKDDTPNRQWRELIKVGLGLDIDMYLGKHKGADDKREAGIPIKTICEIFGHSETKMTERYMYSLKKEKFEAARNVKTKTF